MNQNLVIITSILFLTLFLGLFGCENDRNTDLICKNNPELCADLHKDSWCRYEKADLIRHRFALKRTESPTGEQLYQLLEYLETYSACIELAAGVKHILHPERSDDRQRAYAISTQTLQQLRETTKDNPDVYLAYYRWKRFNDNPSQQIVIEHFRQGLIDEPEMLESIGQHFVREEPQTAQKVFVSLLKQTEYQSINPDWLLALATIYRQQQDFEMSYMLTRANLLISSNTANEQKMQSMVFGDKNTIAKLDQQAELLVSVLNDGSFSQSQFAVSLMPK
ncbi:DUF2989 domain-containing protein [Shewanella maritima]|uniref:DUF2989 domain-containing protein n=1 Tax=Shewanella maritima TaxID=2520507 RepID=UPI003735C4FA